MSIFVTWNVNSIKARHDHVLRFLKESAPDVLMVQELKGETFPHEPFEALGYQILMKGQKTYNGVAAFVKGGGAELICDELPGDTEDEQARFLDFSWKGLRLINIYLPNGNPVDTEKYPYKLKWMERLKDYVAPLRALRIPFFIAGDFNIIPEERDCWDASAWENDALFKMQSRQKWRELENIGLYDAFRLFNGDSAQYSFWDYQAGCWPQNKGIRIDHFLLSPELVNRAQNCAIDAGPRGWDKPSDHTPVLLELEDAA